MGECGTLVTAAAGWVHRNTLALILGATAAAVLAPGPGLWLRGAGVGGAEVLGGRVTVSGPAALLGVLLFLVGLGVRPARLRDLAHRPAPLALGVVANVVLPVTLVAVAAVPLAALAGSAAAEIVLGLLVVAVMPVAASSAAWAQRAGGDAALSLGLVVASTCLGPVTAPAALRLAGWLVGGEVAGLAAVLSAGSPAALVAFAVLPAAAGVGVRAIVGCELVERLKPARSLAGSACLLFLVYSNAAAVVPGLASERDWATPAAAALAVGFVCVAGFGCGWVVAAASGGDSARRTAVTFALGMSNCGAGLVLAAAAFPDRPAVLVPILLYTLAQHLAAAAVGGEAAWAIPASFLRLRLTWPRFDLPAAAVRAA